MSSFTKVGVLGLGSRVWGLVHLSCVFFILGVQLYKDAFPGKVPCVVFFFKMRSGEGTLCFFSFFFQDAVRGGYTVLCT